MFVKNDINMEKSKIKETIEEWMRFRKKLKINIERKNLH